MSKHRIPDPSLRQWLDEQVAVYNRPDFIEGDPVSVPHAFQDPLDREIAGFFAAILAWGQRRTIISKANELMSLMDHAPHAFILQHQDHDRDRFRNFRHRTFQPEDAMFLVEVLQRLYREEGSMENIFARNLPTEAGDVCGAISGFHDYIFDQPYILERTRKHIATPVRQSGCKRINMFLRWMVRKDEAGVDFGIWTKIKPSQLVIPLDVHVSRVARELGLLERKQDDWASAIALTGRLREFDPEDPVRYDFALFGYGISKNT